VTDELHPREAIVIVGAGQAGGELALALRQQGCMQPVVVIGAEAYLPYQRPPLSKAFLAGEIETPALYLRQQAAYERASVQFALNCQVEHIDTRAKVLALSDGRRLEYSMLALCTGGRARRLTVSTAERAERAANFHYLRTIDDVLRIRAGFRAGQRLTIVGGGYVGLEVAAVAVKRGLRVTVLEALPRVLARVTAPEMSIFYERVHRDAGVDVRTGVGVVDFDLSEDGGMVTGIRCNDGSVLETDLVIVGVGLVPNTELAHAAGLAVDNGIVVDEQGRTSDPSIVAAGDCTNHPSLLYERRIRLESVPNAQEQARTAAATLVGKQRVYDAAPWFWSDQYDLKLQMVGLSMSYDDVVVRGSMSARSFALFYFKEGRVIACDAVNRPQEFMLAKRLVAARSTTDPRRLVDESVPLKTLMDG
jgi:3-phenylpropionate/trans-cinnamate dioxygenase ferredoxin reductase component